MSHSEGPHCIGYLAYLVSRLFMRDVDKRLRPLRVSAVQLSPLLALSTSGPMLQRDIVRQSATAQPAMATTLTRLEEEGLVTRSTDASDKRASIFQLSEAGCRVVEAAVPILAGSDVRALQGFSAAEREMLGALLQRVTKNLEESLD